MVAGLRPGCGIVTRGGARKGAGRPRKAAGERQDLLTSRIRISPDDRVRLRRLAGLGFSARAVLQAGLRHIELRESLCSLTELEAVHEQELGAARQSLVPRLMRQFDEHVERGRVWAQAQHELWKAVRTGALPPCKHCGWPIDMALDRDGMTYTCRRCDLRGTVPA